MNTQPASTADTTGSWVVAAVATAVLAVVLGVFGSIGVLIDPLADAYAAPRAQVALLFAAALAVHSLAARRAGLVLNRSGPGRSWRWRRPGLRSGRWPHRRPASE
jgi:hypothetical protein